jgi:hypothetical protein
VEAMPRHFILNQKGGFPRNQRGGEDPGQSNKQVGVESRKRGGDGRARTVHRGPGGGYDPLVDYWKLELPHIRNMLFQEHYDLQLKWSLTKYLLVLLLLCAS